MRLFFHTAEAHSIYLEGMIAHRLQYLTPINSHAQKEPQTFALHRPLPVLHRTGVFHFRDVAAEPLALFASAAPNVSLRFALQASTCRVGPPW